MRDVSSADRLLGVAELAREAGVKPRTLAGYLARGQCPEPSVRLECGPVWFESAVREWLDAREARLERVIGEESAAFEAEVEAVVGERYGYKLSHHLDKRETAKRNARNGKLRRQWSSGRAGLSLSDLHRSGLLSPTVREEQRADAERVVMSRSDGSRQLRALRLRDNRTANRSGCPDGIPF